MAGAMREEIFNISAESYFRALIDYQHYPTLLPEVDQIDVLEYHEDSAKVRYHIHIIKKMSYTLKMKHQRPFRLDWQLDSGDLFKKNSGSWEINSLAPNQCRVKYQLDIELKVFAPKAITNKLVAINLPRMMKSFYDHAIALENSSARVN